MKQGNLTGSARKLKDGAADLHNLIQKWNTFQSDGTNIVNEIANIKLECIQQQPSEEEGNQATINVLPQSLLPLCDKMTELLQRMEKVVSRLNGLVDMCHAVVQLERHNKTTDDVILFQGWDVNQFEDVSREITEMYQKEVALKKSIAEYVCHAKDRQTVMFIVASWVHQPYIEADRLKLLVESILVETKHK